MTSKILLGLIGVNQSEVGHPQFQRSTLGGDKLDKLVTVAQKQESCEQPCRTDLYIIQHKQETNKQPDASVTVRRRKEQFGDSMESYECIQVRVTVIFWKWACVVLFIPSKSLCRYLQEQMVLWVVVDLSTTTATIQPETVLRKQHHYLKSLKAMPVWHLFFFWCCDDNYASASGAGMHNNIERTKLPINIEETWMWYTWRQSTLTLSKCHTQSAFRTTKVILRVRKMRSINWELIGVESLISG